MNNTQIINICHETSRSDKKSPQDLMESLRLCINKAISDCQSVITKNPNVVLSESDLERLLCNCISEKIKKDVNKIQQQENFSVHTQISHYFQENGKNKITDRIDILVLDETQIEKCKNHKGGHYFGLSVALELKYIRLVDSISIARRDFKKWNRIKKDSDLYVVVLIDYKNDADFEQKKARLEKISKEECPNRKYQRKHLHCVTLKKKQTEHK